MASIMTRGSSLWDPVNVYGSPMEGDMITTGTPLVTLPLIDMISNDPILGGVKLIAEAWDVGGLYQVGQFPHWNIWSEWNGKKDETQGEIYVAFNASHMPVVVGLLERPGYRWDPVVDTGKPAPYDFLTDELPDRALIVHQISHFLDSNLYPMLSYSSIILVLRRDV